MASKQQDAIEKYSQGRLQLPTTLERIFFTKNPANWAVMTEQTQSKKKKQQPKPGPHAASSTPINAVLSKSSSSNYTGNFSYYARAAGKGRANQVYDKISPNIKYLYGANSLVDKLYSDYFELNKVACNFNIKARLKGKNSRANTPYNWKAHHMIPGEAFTKMKSAKGTQQPIFNDIQYKLLLMSDYNINNGNNMIALPGNGMDFFQPVHDLIQHPSNHSEWTSTVISELKKVSKSLNKLTKKLNKPHPNVAVKVADQLKKIEDLLWDKLIYIGKEKLASTVKKRKSKLSQADEMLIKQQTADGKTQYPHGALN